MQPNAESTNSVTPVISAYAVESAVWGCFTGSWIALRNMASAAVLDTLVVIPGACLAICSLLICSVTPTRSPAIESSVAQMNFGTWLASVCHVVEVSTNALARKRILADPYLSMASLGISLALSTIQMLISASSVSPNLFHTELSLWADIYLVLVTAFQAGLLGEMYTGSAVVIVLLNMASLFALMCKIWLHDTGSLFRVDARRVVGPITFEALIEILLFCLQSLTWISAMASAYSAGTTAYALAIVSLPAIGVLIARLVRAIRSPRVIEPEVINVGPEADQPSAPSEAQVRTALPAQPATLQFSSKSTGDALLFSRTRPLAGRLKKNS